MLRTTRFLKFKEIVILKEEMLESTEEMDKHLRDGELSTSIRLPRLRLRDLIETSDSISIDHSTLCQDCQ